MPTKAENRFYLLAFTILALTTAFYCGTRESYMRGAIDQHYYEAQQSADAEDAYTWALGTANLKSKQIIAREGK